MKSVNLVRTFLIGAALTVVTQGQSAAFAASGAGNGGNSGELEFTSLGNDVVTIIKSWEQDRLPGVSPVVLAEAVANTRVKFTSQRLYIDGKEVDAKNFPDAKRILVNETRWRSLSGQVDQRMALVLHEYLGILGTERGNYLISSKFLSDLAEDSVRDAKRRWSCIASCGGFVQLPGQVGGIPANAPRGLRQNPVSGVGSTMDEAFQDMSSACPSDFGVVFGSVSFGPDGMAALNPPTAANCSKN